MLGGLLHHVSCAAQRVEALRITSQYDEESRQIEAEMMEWHECCELVRSFRVLVLDMIIHVLTRVTRNTLSYLTYNTHSNVTKYPHARTQVRNCDVLSSVEKNTTQFVAHMCKTRKDVKLYEKRAFMKRLQSPLEVLKLSYEDIPRSLRKGVLENMKIKRSDAFRSILDVLMYMEMSGALKDEGLRGSLENISRLDMKCDTF